MEAIPVSKVLYLTERKMMDCVQNNKYGYCKTSQSGTFRLRMFLCLKWLKSCKIG